MKNLPGGKISLTCRKPKNQWIHKTDRTYKGSKIMTLKAPIDQHNWELSQIRCQKCLPCALHKASQVGIRVQDEIVQWHSSWFITLTVADEYLHEVFPNGEISKKPFQLFLQRLRKRYNYKGEMEISHPITGKKVSPIRALYCGEYGETNLRPHYHCILFNFRPEDIQMVRGTNKKYPKYESKILSELWPYGIIDIGEATFESGGYIGRYTAKKYHMMEDPRLIGKAQPFIEYPRGFGLGRIGYEKNKNQWFHHDFKYVQKEAGATGRHSSNPFRVALPQYYNRLRRKEDLESYEKVVEKRVKRGQEALQKKYKNSKIYQKIKEQEAELHSERTIKEIEARAYAKGKRKL